MIRVKVLQNPQVHVATKATVTVSDGGFERGYAAGYEEGKLSPLNLKKEVYKRWRIKTTTATGF